MSYEAIAQRLPGVGTKRVCISCTTRFYDLARTPPVCPKCGAEQPPDAPRVTPIRRSPVRLRMVKPAAPVARDADDDVAPVLEPDEDEAEPDEDAEDLDEDEDLDVEVVLDEPPDI